MKRSLCPHRRACELSDSVHQQLTNYTLTASTALTVIVVILLWAFTAPVAQAQTFTTLYNFGGAPDGAQPYGALIRDQAGHLYGTTYGGGYLSCKDAYHPYGCGLVFTVNTDGSETVLHRFTGGRADGKYPSAPLLRDRHENLYGTAVEGGAHNCGVIFKIDTARNETVLYNFKGGTKDGCYPEQGLVMDRFGNLYGTTAGGGNQSCHGGCGTVFKLTKCGKEIVLHSFSGADGSEPAYGHLLMDTSGDLYGVTSGENTRAGGTLYKLTNKGKLTILHSFTGGSDGCFPLGTPALDKSGNLYGTTAECGFWNAGTLWKVSKDGAETILHNFGLDGIYPEAGVVLDSNGNVYGNTTLGGAYYGGTLWEQSKAGKFRVLHSFTGGSWVLGDVLHADKSGLYGTTVDGGTSGYGSVWSYLEQIDSRSR